MIQTSKTRLQGRQVVVCAGLQSDRIAQLDGLKLDMRIVGFQGRLLRTHRGGQKEGQAPGLPGAGSQIPVPGHTFHADDRTGRWNAVPMPCSLSSAKAMQPNELQPQRQPGGSILRWYLAPVPQKLEKRTRRIPQGLFTKAILERGQEDDSQPHS